MVPVVGGNERPTATAIAETLPTALLAGQVSELNWASVQAPDRRGVADQSRREVEVQVADVLVVGARAVDLDRHVGVTAGLRRGGRDAEGRYVEGAGGRRTYQEARMTPRAAPYRFPENQTAIEYPS